MEDDHILCTSVVVLPTNEGPDLGILFPRRLLISQDG
jgi:hypothetical protein